MKYAEALSALIDQEYAIELRNHNSLWDNNPEAGAKFPPPTRDEVACNRESIRIGATVMGEGGVGNDFYRDEEVDDAFGIFENCREYGLTVSINGWTFSVYEHRNSDYIIVNGCPTAEVHSYGPYAEDGDKYDYLFECKWKQYHEAAKALIDMMRRVRECSNVTRDDLKALVK